MLTLLWETDQLLLQQLIDFLMLKDHLNKILLKLFREPKVDLTFIDQDLQVQWVLEDQLKLEEIHGQTH